MRINEEYDNDLSFVPILLFLKFYHFQTTMRLIYYVFEKVKFKKKTEETNIEKRLAVLISLQFGNFLPLCILLSNLSTHFFF